MGDIDLSPVSLLAMSVGQQIGFIVSPLKKASLKVYNK